MKFILLLTLLGYAHSKTCNDGETEYRLSMYDGYQNGWQALKLQTKDSSGTTTHQLGSNGASKATMNIEF